MKKIGTLLLFVFTIFLIISYWKGKTLFSQRIQSQTEKKIFNNDFGIPMWIAWNSVSENQFSRGRDIFLLIQPDDFTEEKLKGAFMGLAKNYHDPHFLIIKAFSDEHILENAIKYRLSELPNSERVGYFRASYARIREEEKMSYSSDPNTDELITVILKEKSIVYSGNSNSDLGLAAYEGDIEKVKTLLVNGADPNVTDETGDTPLMNSILAKNREIGRLLLPKTNVSATNSEGFNALMYAAAGGDAQMVRELLLRGSHVNAQNKSGYTALMLAVAREQSAVVKELLAKRPNLKLKNSEGMTALSIGQYTKNTKIFTLLKNAGARE